MTPLRPAWRPLLGLALFLVAAGSAARLAFALAFRPAGLGLIELAPALGLGLRYDARVALLSLLPLWLLSLTPAWRAAAGRFAMALWLLAAAVWGLAGVLDAGQFAYLGQRLSAVLWTLAQDPREAVGMVWQTYPVLRIAAGLAAWLLVCALVWRGLWRVPTARTGVRRRVRLAQETLLLLLALGLVHGRFSQYPLRWSDAVGLTPGFARLLALNPLQNLVDTWTFRAAPVDEAAIRRDFDRVRGFVGLPPLRAGEPLSLRRDVPARAGTAPSNVVLVLLESFAAHKTGALGSPLGATPNFDALAAEGLLFTRMMSAHPHTARGVFATLTGLPDVSIESTASRNPAATEQQTLVNEFRPHARFYFIGGSTSWANVRGLLNASIDGVQIYEEGRLRAPVQDVWGASDKDLLLEANEVLRAQTGPFFAVIQTSGNHRPYNIPAADRAEFKPPRHDAQTLVAHGFFSQAEFEAFAYLDWCLGRFMAQARREAYAANTVFAFVGDHGIIGATGPHLPPSWRELAVTQGHTPFLIHAPGRVAPGRINRWAQQVDVLPTLAALTGIAHRNTTLGRDLLNTRFDDRRVAFAFQFTGPGESALLVGDRMLVARTPPALHDLMAADPRVNRLDAQLSAEDADLMTRWGDFPGAYERVARYLQTHNPRLRNPGLQD